MNQAHYDRVVHPQTCNPDDFWGQVRRTLHGKAIPQEQFDIMFSMIRQGLAFQPSDILLDLACGNGRLGFEFFDEVQEYLGVDISPSLISIAKKEFESPPTHTFLENDAHSYCMAEFNPSHFNKVLCYGAFSYFSHEQALGVLSLLRTRFTSLERLFIGPIPDKDRADMFFQGNIPLPLDDHTSAIGRWYTQNEFQNMCEKCGWHVDFPEIPHLFYQAHYRFNAILT